MSYRRLLWKWEWIHGVIFRHFHQLCHRLWCLEWLLILSILQLYGLHCTMAPLALQINRFVFLRFWLIQFSEGLTQTYLLRIHLTPSLLVSLIQLIVLKVFRCCAIIWIFKWIRTLLSSFLMAKERRRAISWKLGLCICTSSWLHNLWLIKLGICSTLGWILHLLGKTWIRSLRAWRRQCNMLIHNRCNIAILLKTIVNEWRLRIVVLLKRFLNGLIHNECLRAFGLQILKFIMIYYGT